VVVVGGSVVVGAVEVVVTGARVVVVGGSVIGVEWRPREVAPEIDPTATNAAATPAAARPARPRARSLVRAEGFTTLWTPGAVPAFREMSRRWLPDLPPRAA
jgi:hypothetical protein